MYFYLYDTISRDRRFARTIARIEHRLQTLGLGGRSEKLTVLKSMKDAVDGALKRGVDSIIAIGDDSTMSKIIAHAAEQDVLLGYVPIGGETRLASLLGLPVGEGACDILSQRIIEKLDVGKANATYFLSFLELEGSRDVVLEFDGSFRAETLDGAHTITLYNISQHGSPTDGVLEACIAPTEENGKRPMFRRGRAGGGASILPFRSLRVKSLGASVTARADGQTVVKTPMTVTVAAKKVRVIVGKPRKFRAA